MRVLRNIGLAVLVSAVLSACMGTTEEDVYHDEGTYENCSAIVIDESSSCLNGSGQCANPDIVNTNVNSVEPVDVYNLPKEITAAGVRICPPRNRCADDGRLPPQPCLQPIPQYYGNVSQEMIEDGIVLIHPYTRAQVICLDMPGEGAVNCVQNFKAAGFVLITDIPQLPAKYDFLKKGTYPTRRWRGKGEVVPRW